MPLWPGMTTSMRTTSGFCSRASNTASLTSPASPTTSMSCSASSSRRRPARTTAWSSTIRTRIAVLLRHRIGTSATIVVPAPSRRLDREPTVEQPDALLHADEAEPLALAACRAETPPVVLDHGHHDAFALASRGRSPAGAGVLDDVRQRLLHDPVERGLDLGREPLESRFAWTSTAIPVCSAKASPSRSSAGTRPKSSSAFGRSSTASRRTSWSVWTTARGGSPRPRAPRRSDFASSTA